MADAVPDPEVCARWRLTPQALPAARAGRTWAVTRDGAGHILKRLDPADSPDWPYPLRVAAALHARGWPVPEPTDEPLVTPGGVWLLYRRLPGRPLRSSGPDSPAQQRTRGRLLARLHAELAATGITAQRGGFRSPVEVLADPALERTLRAYERIHPADGARLRACREAAAARFAALPTGDAPRSVVHGDFAPWNLLFDGDRLTGVLDFEIAHHNFQVADFALAWRGYQDEVIRGYDEVRPLSDLEWSLIVPVFHAWLFLGVAGRDPATLDLSWSLAHLQKRSGLSRIWTG
ncbi:phosphotransferase enzyme family protein [Actinoplanes teichomyceticus]|uniref:Ser/Thr protein kinase RdoA (MazF antagonist) n=1 Tax=Actinoplanes teichomyceticus TaxID=1867 RepID=A0A561VJ40_ACTTI|nr:phosphotransferase [Actinoplanes teichomyceticus]TWG11584.1 Ser/Thr protein kinase RdoA (MazF antagonist) [Actinoplanes teichomyceticus]GIF16029.1 hypothetical protein Ate01nite_60610 [Actinoplanes teichomyceticus]